MLKYALSILTVLITSTPIAAAKSASDLQVVSYLNKDAKSVYVLIKNPAEQSVLKCDQFELILTSAVDKRKVVVSRSNVILNPGEELEIELAGEPEAIAQNLRYSAAVGTRYSCEIIK